MHNGREGAPNARPSLDALPYSMLFQLLGEQGPRTRACVPAACRELLSRTFRTPDADTQCIHASGSSPIAVQILADCAEKH